MSFSCTPDVVMTGLTLTIPYGDALAFARKLSDTSDWTYSVRDDERELNPDATSGTWSGILNGRAYAADGTTYNKRLRVYGLHDAVAYQLPDGIPDGGNYTLVEGDPDESLVWRGKGVGAALSKKKISLPTVTSTVGGEVYAQTVLASIFASAGITADVSAVLPNYLVPRMTLQGGTRLEYLTQLLEVVQGEWYENETGIVCFVPDWATESYDYDYSTADVGLREVQAVDSGPIEVANYLTVQRADDTAGVIGKGESGPTAVPFGRQAPITFDTPSPVLSVSYDVKHQLGGEVSDVYFYDAVGGVIDARACKGAIPEFDGSGTTAYSSDFDLGEALWNPGAEEGTYLVEYRADASGGIYPDTTTSLIVQDAASIASGVGRHHDTLGPNCLIADEATLQLWGERSVYKRARRPVRRQGTLFPANYNLRPGHRVRVYDAQLEVYLTLTVTQVAHTIVPREWDRTTVFEGIRYVL